MTEKYPFVKAISTGQIYKYKGETEPDKFEFENVTEGRRGLLTAEQSKSLFSIPMTLNEMIIDNPCIEQLVSSLKLSIKL